MRPITHSPRPLLGPGEWLGQYLRLLARTVDERPVGSTEAPTDWRYDWTEHKERRYDQHENKFE